MLERGQGGDRDGGRDGDRGGDRGRDRGCNVLECKLPAKITSSYQVAD